MQPRFEDYQQHIAQLVQAALTAVNPQTAVSRHLKRTGRRLTIGSGNNASTFDLDHGRLYLVSVGKAAVPMAKAVLELLADAIEGAVIVPKKGERNWATELGDWVLGERLRLFPAAHPVSDADSVAAATLVFDLLAKTTKNDLVLFLISGGASALLTRPLLALGDWQRLTDVLLASGCSIQELNTVRRHLDEVKGGGLARAAAPSACISLILSDVVGNPLGAIGSGPTVLASDSPADALNILQRYGVPEKMETAVWRRILLSLHRANNQHETQLWPAVNRHTIVGDVRQAATAAMLRAVQLGFVSDMLTTHLEGEAREVGRVAAAIARDTQPGCCRILGGETTVTLRGKGIGGRNQEVALAAAIALAGKPRTVLASVATDGDDGPTGAAGAVVTGETAVFARQNQLDPVTYLDNNDSHTFFTRFDSHHLSGHPAQTLIKTGQTGTNVNDLIIILTYDQP